MHDSSSFKIWFCHHVKNRGENPNHTAVLAVCYLFLFFIFISCKMLFQVWMPFLRFQIISSLSLFFICFYFFSYLVMFCVSFCFALSGSVKTKSVNLSWPSDAIWRQRSGSTLAQVMACCLTAPSHYLNQCWPRSLSPYGVTRPQLVKWTLA